MKNFKQPGSRLTLVAPYDVVSGAGMLVGTLFAIAVFSVLAGAPVEAERNGVFTLPKAAGAATQGQKLYWDDAAKNVTTTAGGNKLIGAASLAAQAGDATVDVVLIPTAA